MSLRTICIPLYTNCQNLDVSGPYEVFSGANRYLQALGKPRAYELVLTAADSASVRTDSGLRLQPDQEFSKLRGRLDTLLVPGGDGYRAAEQDPALVEAIRRLSASSRRVASVCTGAFLLAAAGLLDGKRATTHWSACRELARRYPRIEVDPDPIYVRSGRTYTSAGVTAGIDLALALVEDDLGRDTALTVARWLVLFLRRPANQRQFSAQLQGQMAQRDALQRVQSHIADHLDEDLHVERLAAIAAMSPRNFARYFKAEVGVTPGRYVVQLRLEAARRLLEEGRQPIEKIAADCGFGTPETLRRVFIRHLKTVPREYRQRFQALRDPTTRRNPDATVDTDL